MSLHRFVAPLITALSSALSAGAFAAPAAPAGPGPGSCGAPAVAIHDIQGSGSSSPLRLDGGIAVEGVSSRGRWNELRPMIEPVAPPSRIWRISSSRPSVLFAAPPENTTRRRPLNADCTT